jgi:hypothetical protein
MTYDDAVYEIEEHFVKLWNIKFKDIKNLCRKDTMKNYLINGSDEIWHTENWFEIIDYIEDNFDIHDTFEMLQYLDNSFDIEDTYNTIDNFIICVCREYRDETDYMKYDYYVDASNKIKQWWKKIYWSPKTKVGIKRFNRECEKLGY